MAKELFTYFHPFLFNDFFQDKLTKYQFQVLFEIVQIFSSSSTRKEFNIQQFLYSYSSNINGTRKKNIKGFKTLKELKFTKTRMLVQPGINGGPDQIVAIFMRSDMDNIASIFKSKYK